VGAEVIEESLELVASLYISLKSNIKVEEQHSMFEQNQNRMDV